MDELKDEIGFLINIFNIHKKYVYEINPDSLFRMGTLSYCLTRFMSKI